MFERKNALTNPSVVTLKLITAFRLKFSEALIHIFVFYFYVLVFYPVSLETGFIQKIYDTTIKKKYLD